jgi:hypothetical protein
VTVKSLATGVAAVAAIGAAAAGVTCVASVTGTLPQVKPVVFSAPSPASGRYPQPLDPVLPGADVPTPDQLVSLLNSLQDPSVPFSSKSNLVQGGIGGVEGHFADKKLQQAAAKGSLPLTFNITNIRPTGPGSDTREPHVRRPGRLGVVAHLGDDADPVGAVGGRLTAAGWADISLQS